MKPANVLLDEEGNAYLSDFGVALGAGSIEQTTGTMIRGTPAYLSPEQIRLEPLTPRSDIYSLGVVLYEMLTGEHPFAGSSLRRPARSAPRAVDPLRATDTPRASFAAVDAVIARATAKDPNARFEDAEELAAALPGSCAKGPVMPSPPPASSGTRTRDFAPFSRRTPRDFFGRETLVRRLVERMAERRPGVTVPARRRARRDRGSRRWCGPVSCRRCGEESVAGSEHWFVVELRPRSPSDASDSNLPCSASRSSPPPSLLEELERRRARAGPGRRSRAARRGRRPADRARPARGGVHARRRRCRTLAVPRRAPGGSRRPRRSGAHRRDAPRGLLRSAAVGSRLRRPACRRAPRRSRRCPRSSSNVRSLARRTHVGLRVEPGLIAAMVTEVADRPGALPLLQYALTELADRSDVSTLTLEDVPAHRRRVGRPRQARGAALRAAEREQRASRAGSCSCGLSRSARGRRTQGVASAVRSCSRSPARSPRPVRWTG